MGVLSPRVLSPRVWQNGMGEPTMIVLDSNRGGGIRMSSDEIIPASLKAGLLAEFFHAPEKRCLIYRDTFRGTNFDRTEYPGLGYSAESAPGASADNE